MEEPLSVPTPFSVLGPGSAPALWPSGPWESSPWLAAPGQQLFASPLGGQQALHQADDLYPDSYGLPLSGFDDDLAMATLATMTTYQEYHVQSDSLFPSDSYAQPPPDYPLYNWTLPYGPVAGVPLGPAMGPALGPVLGSGLGPTLGPAPSPRRTPRPARHRGRGGHQGAGEPVHLQFKGASEMRRESGSAPTPEQVQQVQQAPPCTLLDEFLDDDVVEVEVRSSHPGEASGSERVMFDSIEEALLTIEAQDLADAKLQVSRPSPPPVPVATTAVRTVAMRSRDFDRGADRSLSLCDGTQEDVMRAAKSLFSKRTRTLYHWLYPDTSKTKLKATVSAAWDTLAETEKQFYLSQVLGRFGIQASSLMINPQLDGIKDLPMPLAPPASPVGSTSTWTSPTETVITRGTTGPTTERLGGGRFAVAAAASRASPKVLSTSPSTSSSSGRASRATPRPSPALSEAQQAVDGLFASCSDSDTWTSYSMSGRASCSNKRPALGDEVPQVPTQKRPRALLELETGLELALEGLEGDEELSSELETFRLLANDRSDEADFWRESSDIFPHVRF